MHEAGIAASIIEIAENVAQGRAIAKIHVKLGAFTGVVREALEFAFEAQGSDIVLEVERIPLTGACRACGWTGAPEEEYCLVCPRCQTPVEIVSGRELQVEWVELKKDFDGTDLSKDQSSEPERPMRRSQPASV